MVYVILLLGLIFLFPFPPLGIILLILGTIGLILKFVVGTGKAAVGVGKAVGRAATTRKCPNCITTISNKATVCPNCKSKLAEDALG